jgi:hypothetical protein
MWTLALLLQEDDIALGRAATVTFVNGLEIAAVVGVIIVLIVILRRR